jgi:hypothetical protein
MSKQVEAFKLTVSVADIADLRDRLERTRFPDQAPGPPWAYGTEVAWIRGLIDYWREKFDWTAQEALLNTKCGCMTSICISSMSRDKDLTRIRYCYRTVGLARFLNFLS